LLGGGWSALVGSLMLRAPDAATVSALVWCAGVAVVIANHLRMVVLGRAPHPTAPVAVGAS
jgi:hypothetical protein